MWQRHLDSLPGAEVHGEEGPALIAKAQPVIEAFQPLIDTPGRHRDMERGGATGLRQILARLHQRQALLRHPILFVRGVRLPFLLRGRVPE